MKEVKEVVHVPTKELAEEVLRVLNFNDIAKGLYLADWHYYEEETCFKIHKGFGFATRETYKEHDYKILSAQEFLSRYKTKFIPIAMKCTQEQFNAVKGKLVGCRMEDITEFESCSYLVNNYGNYTLEITNTWTDNKSDYGRQVFEEWNEQTFLEYCGIEVKEGVIEIDQLRKENEYLKQQLKAIHDQLKAIHDQPKVGDVCLFWDDGFNYKILSKLNENGGVEGVGKYDNCIKATDENIKAKINELEND